MISTTVRRQGVTSRWAVVAALGLGLTACGGGGGGEQANTSVSSAPPSTNTAESSSNVAGGLTPPGTQLKFGQPAIVGWVPPSLSSATGPRKSYKLQLTVASIKKGTIADFKNVQLKPAEQKSTPYYVTVRIKALAAVAPPGTNDPDVTLDAIDDRGQKQGSITFLGTFSRCDDASPPKPFVRGKSYASCLAYLMPGGGSIQQMQWANGPAKGDSVTPYFDKPIVWAG